MTRTRTDREGVIEKFGVPPERIVDYLALMGDAIDNIPGVPKCGPKTAAKWLNEYGSLDDVIAHAGDVGGKIGENLRATLPQLPLSRQLATIKTDVDLTEGPRDLKLRPRDTDALRELYARYEFRQALKELDASGSTDDDHSPSDPPSAAKEPDPEREKSPTAEPGSYELVTTQESFEAWLAKLRGAELFAFDTETTASIRCGPSWWVFPSACRWAKPATSRSATITPAPRRNFRSRTCSRH